MLHYHHVTSPAQSPVPVPVFTEKQAPAAVSQTLVRRDRGRGLLALYLLVR